MTVYPTFQERLREAIEKTGMSLNEIDKRSGYSRSYYRNLLSGKARNPTIGFIEVVAEVTGVSPAYLVGWEN